MCAGILFCDRDRGIWNGSSARVFYLADNGSGIYLCADPPGRQEGNDGKKKRKAYRRLLQKKHGELPSGEVVQVRGRVAAGVLHLIYKDKTHAALRRWLRGLLEQMPKELRLEQEIASATTRHVTTHATGGAAEVLLHKCEFRDAAILCQASQQRMIMLNRRTFVKTAASAACLAMHESSHAKVARRPNV